jgi:hypothetical protein
MIAFVSCKKDNEESSVNQKLTNRSEKTWVLRSQLTNDKEVLNDEWKEILDEDTKVKEGWIEKLVKDCEKDNEWTFQDAGKIAITPGYLRCYLGEKDSEATYFLGGPNNESIYFTTLDSIKTYVPSLGKDSTFKFYKIQKTDILLLTNDELRYKSVYYASYGTKVQTTIHSFIRK